MTLATRWWECSQPTHRPVVLLPGTGLTAADWDVVASDLSQDRTVHAVDLRGHGGSDWPGTYSIEAMADDVMNLLPQLGAEVDLVGHSLGGLVACRVAATSTQVRALVLEDVGLMRRRQPAMPARPPGDLPFDWAMVEQTRPEVDSPAADWRDVLRRITVPVLAIGGGPDSFVPQEWVGDLVETVSTGTLLTIDAGHEIHSTRPTEFLAAVRAFLDKTASQQS
ncbi:alpha/beta fold hydrolase [Knoellia sp. CPCC 206453]|uniref:alpha/beta fold hydrolase n=1 Tax=Knoellia pratensis TaxID=3404796 RepID=UPI0036097924